MQERPVALKIFGILNIGFGAWGLMEALMSSMAGGFGDLSAFAKINPFIASIAACMDALHKDPGYLLWMKVSAPMDLAANLVLIAAGIGLLRRKNWGRVASLGYAIYGLVFPLLNVIALFRALHGMLAEASQKYGAVLMGALGLVALVGLILTLAYPALLIFFLTRPRLRAACAPTEPAGGSTL